MWEIFSDLHSSRHNSGYGPVPITIVDIKFLFEIYEIDDPELQYDYFRHIKAMDLHFIKYSNDELESKRKK